MSQQNLTCESREIGPWSYFHHWSKFLLCKRAGGSWAPSQNEHEILDVAPGKEGGGHLKKKIKGTDHLMPRGNLIDMFKYKKA